MGIMLFNQRQVNKRCQDFFLAQQSQKNTYVQSKVRDLQNEISQYRVKGNFLLQL